MRGKVGYSTQARKTRRKGQEVKHVERDRGKGERPTSDKQA